MIYDKEFKNKSETWGFMYNNEASNIIYYMYI